jgi:predicted transcriptional regulator
MENNRTENNEILEEVVLPERTGFLGSKSYDTVNGKIVKTTRIIFCDNCGYRLDENKPIVLCKTCNKKLCSSHSCTFEYQRKHYCEEHIQQILPLSAQGFEILHCILVELEPGKVRELANISNDSYKQALNELVELGYVKEKGVSIFKTYKILDRGILAWQTYLNAYSMQGDVSHFLQKLTEDVEVNGCLVRPSANAST